MTPDLTIERRYQGSVCGVDEVGRGPLAGPVIACAVVLPAGIELTALGREIDDSKKLTARQRRVLASEIRAEAMVAIGHATVEEIDTLNILRASGLAMARAVAKLPVVPDHALVDGNRVPDLPCPGTAVVGGDGRSLSIAAASIIAKHCRDRLMARFARRYPGYGWERNAGYGTAEHRAALRTLGVTPLHRRTFAPVSEILAVES